MDSCSSDAGSCCGSTGRHLAACESELRVANERIAELERQLYELRKASGLIHEVSHSDASTQSEATGSQEEPPESSFLVRKEDDLLWVQGPKWKPFRTSCSACRGQGHTIGQCLRALEDRVGKAHVHCVNGWHVPYLHGVWRCNYCGEHLKSKTVREQQPELYWKQAQVENAKVQKYGSPFQ